jgi:hypothetical protein
MTTATNPVPNVPLPAGAVEVDDWFDPKLPIGEHQPLTGADVQRYFRGTSREIHLTTRDPHLAGPDVRAEVLIDGFQYADGRIERGIFLQLPTDYGLSVPDARAVGQALTEAADEADGWVTR